MPIAGTPSTPRSSAKKARDLPDLERRARRNADLAAVEVGSHRLHETVAERLKDVHQQPAPGRGGGATVPSAPARIMIRPGFIKGAQPTATEAGHKPFASQLIGNGRGLQLRLALLLLFEAQCRLAHGTRWTNVRTVKPTTDQRHLSWSELVVTHADGHPKKIHGLQALRTRQVAEALIQMEAKGPVKLPPPTRHRGATRYDSFDLLDESGRTGDRYVVPPPLTDDYAYLDSRFFLNGWIWALTDAEIAVYLMLAELRRCFPGEHATRGVFLSQGERTDPHEFGITKGTYRAHDALTRFYLIDRLASSNRDYETGRVRDFEKEWRTQHVESHKFQINDEALNMPAFAKIDQVLNSPTGLDQLRMIGF